MTPRQLAAYRFLADRRQEREHAMWLSTMALAFHGDSDAMKKQIEKWGEQ